MGKSNTDRPLSLDVVVVCLEHVSVLGHRLGGGDSLVEGGLELLYRAPNVAEPCNVRADVEKNCKKIDRINLLMVFLIDGSTTSIQIYDKKVNKTLPHLAGHWRRSGTPCQAHRRAPSSVSSFHPAPSAQSHTRLGPAEHTAHQPSS